MLRLNLAVCLLKVNMQLSKGLRFFEGDRSGDRFSSIKRGNTLEGMTACTFHYCEAVSSFECQSLALLSEAGLGIHQTLNTSITLADQNNI